MIGKLVILMGVSLFLGFVLFGVGGLFIPSIYRISTSLICTDELEIEESRYDTPTEHTTTVNIYCHTKTSGEEKNVTGKVYVISSLIYSLFTFLVFCFIMLINRIRRNTVEEIQSPAATPGLMESFPYEVDARLSENDLRESLQRLKELRDDHLITEQEYENKKAEILSRF
jgi:hypothetical protein